MYASRSFEEILFFFYIKIFQALLWLLAFFIVKLKTDFRRFITLIFFRTTELDLDNLTPFRILCFRTFPISESRISNWPSYMNRFLGKWVGPLLYFTFIQHCCKPLQNDFGVYPFRWWLSSLRSVKQMSAEPWWRSLPSLPKWRKPSLSGSPIWNFWSTSPILTHVMWGGNRLHVSTIWYKRQNSDCSSRKFIVWHSRPIPMEWPKKEDETLLLKVGSNSPYLPASWFYISSKCPLSHSRTCWRACCCSPKSPSDPALSVYQIPAAKGFGDCLRGGG